MANVLHVWVDEDPSGCTLHVGPAEFRVNLAIPHFVYCNDGTILRCRRTSELVYHVELAREGSARWELVRGAVPEHERHGDDEEGRPLRSDLVRLTHRSTDLMPTRVSSALIDPPDCPIATAERLAHLVNHTPQQALLTKAGPYVVLVFKRGQSLVEMLVERGQSLADLLDPDTAAEAAAHA